MAVPMFLHLVNLPESDPVYRSLTAALVRQVDALLERQDPQTGLWHTVLDDPTSYPETSCAAGFVAGILMGIRHVGLLIPVFNQCAAVGKEGTDRRLTEG